MSKRLTLYIPDAITCLNLLSGCVAIYMAFNLTASYGALDGAHWAMIAIGCAAVFDFLDGASARLLGAYSDVGKDLDSLSDLVSFGVAPAMLILNLMQGRGDSVAAFAALLIAVCGALRLARFNNDSSQSVNFRGLPIPANAIFWIGFYGWVEHYGYPSAWVTVPLIVVVSLAMTSNIKMFSLKFKNFALAENFLRYVMIFVAVLFVICYGLTGLMWTIVFYAVLSLLGRSRF